MELSAGHEAGLVGGKEEGSLRHLADFAEAVDGNVGKAALLLRLSVEGGQVTLEFVPPPPFPPPLHFTFPDPRPPAREPGAW